jgi:hypothetical protein
MAVLVIKGKHFMDFGYDNQRMLQPQIIECQPHTSIEIAMPEPVDTKDNQRPAVVVFGRNPKRVDGLVEEFDLGVKIGHRSTLSRQALAIKTYPSGAMKIIALGNDVVWRLSDRHEWQTIFHGNTLPLDHDTDFRNFEMYVDTCHIKTQQTGASKGPNRITKMKVTLGS